MKRQLAPIFERPKKKPRQDRLYVLLSGDREWKNREAIQRELRAIQDKTPKETIIHLVHGDCRGADKLGAKIATELGFVVLGKPADWKKYKKAAGPIRNQEMLDQHPIDMVVAFHPNLAQSKGTKDMVARARKRGIPCTVHSC